jgi:hypothetical protein
MLDPAQVLAALEARQDEFLEAQQVGEETLAILGLALETIPACTLAEVAQLLAGIANPGARPTSEIERFNDLVLAFPQQWSDHHAARTWARSILEGVPTFAADGSQIPPSRELSIPVGLVQVGWFENRHRPEGQFVKDVFVEILTPADTLNPDGRRIGPLKEIVNWRRFALEMARLTAYMQANAQAEPKPICFFDGSLVISFVQHLYPDHQALYVNAVKQLLAVSAETGVPLAALAAHFAGMPPDIRVSDGELLRPRMAWGDRTLVFACARDDGVLDKYYDEVYFVYLKTTADNPPARVEFPRWVFERGEHERVIDLVRAECVVGLGYPYCLETADAVAVLTAEDRERFYALFQRFAEGINLPLRFSRKATSKRLRRV